MKRLCITRKLFLLAFIVFFSPPPVSATNAELTLAIADSTCSTIKQVGKIFSRQTNIKLNYICQSSGLLVKGIIEEAILPDYFLSANKKWMNIVVEAGYVDSAAVTTNWGNQLVVTSFPSKTGDLQLQGLADLLTPSVEKVLIGDPEIAPYGAYAKQALVNADMWEKIQPKLKISPKISLSIRSLKKLSLTTPCIVAFLYKTNISDKMQIHFAVPQNLYPRINYFSAPLIRSVQKTEMALFLDFIRGDKASSIFESAGFVVNLPAQSHH
ncbi:molybdenum ABC transporter, periplasmic molybdate-binding protein [Desulfocapsa sulfexigens DSM 10523]|uniref:Molybdenum ABC transporter, periplasmic molybdate-binding protein n=1 Tax=Desulfocapsa sulfexigens (strain DSM 10523 / SB164P1) TaxID=1167006 RepID=M1PKV4_DESSD|nr:molybdate ABC transporter substrate-binding protein [Desulfocapsa sulfexigens]AGF77111.1 molybdenum ABC transporter, periplasmic molybdate-binding protein [Desulfocapsa sulfexigens DSM 10523]